MIIRFCLSLAAKSLSAYEELRDSKILQLPSKRTLRDYRNAIKPTAGFNKDVINELTIAASKLSGHQRYLTVAFDEMKIKESLIFNKNSNELVGYARTLVTQSLTMEHLKIRINWQHTHSQTTSGVI